MIEDELPRGRGLPRNLSRDRIVEAALAIVREQGVAGLSMRRLAAELDATVAVTYHYFPNKSAVVDAVSDLVVTQILAADDPTRPWRERMVSLMLAQDRVLLEHPGIARVLVENHDKPAGTRWTEAFLRVLLDGGFTPATAAQAFSLISFYINPAFLIERSGVSSERLVDAAAVTTSAPGEYPAIQAVQPFFEGRSFSAQYEEGARILVSVLEPGGMPVQRRSKSAAGRKR